MTYGIDRIEAHAMPTPTIPRIRKYGSVANIVEIKSETAERETDRVNQFAVEICRQPRNRKSDQKADDVICRKHQTRPFVALLKKFGRCFFVNRAERDSADRHDRKTATYTAARTT